MIATLEKQKSEAAKEREDMICYMYIEDMPEFPQGNITAYIKNLLAELI